MNRWEFIKAEWLRCAVGLLLTASLPFMTEWHNPAGMQPITIFGFLAALFWIGFVGVMLISDESRGGSLNSRNRR